MEKSKKLNIIGQLLLFSATIGWGTSFTLLKDVIEEVSMYYVIGVRFLCASIIMTLIFIKKLKKINKGTLFRGVLLGVILCLAYLTQTWGLEQTTPGENAFLTATYNVMCPFVFWIFYKKRPKISHTVAAVLCAIGIGLVALSNNTESGSTFFGYSMSLVSAVFFCFQILVIDYANKKGDETIITLLLELTVVGVIFTILSLIIDLPQGIQIYSLNTNQLLTIIMLTLVCTAYAQTVQVIGMKYTKPTQAALILSLESVFGVLFSIIMGREKTSVLIYIGFAVIFIAMLISETEFSIKRLKNKNKEIKENEVSEKEKESESEQKIL